MNRFLERSNHSRDEERHSLMAREARCRNGEREDRGEAQTHPSYEKAERLTSGYAGP
jgi:hypothetical protein